MGSGGVAIAALPTVTCLKVPFSDGLGGGQFVVPKMDTLLYSTLLKLKHKEMSPAQYRAHYYKGSNN